MNAPLPENEGKRLEALRRYDVLDSAPELAFDDLTLLAAQICETPIALVSLVDADRQWFKSKRGISTKETPRKVAFCAHAILEPDRLFEVPDAFADSRFSDNPIVLTSPRVRFYAGAPLIAPGGEALGTLCVMDHKPRSLRPDQRAALGALSRCVVSHLELRRHSLRTSHEAERRQELAKSLQETNARLGSTHLQTARRLELAEESRSALLSILEDEQRTGKALARSNQALKMLSSCNEAMITAKDESELLGRVCRIAVEVGGHSMAFVGFREDGPDKLIRPAAQYGDALGYLDEVDLSWEEDRPQGRGPTGRCLRMGQPVVCGDIRDPAFEFFSMEAAERRGFRSLVCLPLRNTSGPFGVLSLLSTEAGKIGDNELRLLQELADDLAIGIGALRSRVVREQAEEALMVSLKEKEALLKEVHHRVKNNLQVIASLLRLEGRRIDHPITLAVLTEMQGRIQSMALLHETLYRSGNFAGVDLAPYITQMAQQIFRSQLARPGSVELKLVLESVELGIDQAIPCGLIVNELVSNCLKHGFPEGRTGEVEVHLHRSEDGLNIRLTVEDTGVGLPPGFAPESQKSLGLQLVSDLARQLQGTFHIGPGPQAAFAIDFPRVRARTGEVARPPRTPPTQAQEAP